MLLVISLCSPYIAQYYLERTSIILLSNLHIKLKADDPEKCNLCTTAFYEGSVAVMDPRSSWTAKWLRVDNYLPGVYAITVTGQFDKDIEDELESRGCRYRCRPHGSS